MAQISHFGHHQSKDDEICHRSHYYHYEDHDDEAKVVLRHQDQRHCGTLVVINNALALATTVD